MAKKMSKADKVKALREKLKQQDLGGGGAGFFSPKVGVNTIRILPEVGEMDFFFQPVGRHWFPDGRKVYCPSFTTEKEKDCPACEIVRELHNLGDPKSKKMAEDIGLRRSWWMNVIDRDNPGLGPLKFTPGVTIFNSVISLINDPDYGDVTDLYEGTDIIVERDGTGKTTSYEVRAKRKESELSDDEDEMEDWLNGAVDLSWVEVSDDPDEDEDLSEGHAIHVLPYDRIVEAFGLDSFDEEGFEEDEDEEEEEPAPKRKPKKTAKREPVDDDEDESEDAGEEDDEEDEPKQLVKRRMARRSTRR